MEVSLRFAQAVSLGVVDIDFLSFFVEFAEFVEFAFLALSLQQKEKMHCERRLPCHFLDGESLVFFERKPEKKRLDAFEQFGKLEEFEKPHFVKKLKVENFLKAALEPLQIEDFLYFV